MAKLLSCFVTSLFLGYHFSFFTSKHGHCFVHSIGSTSPLLFRSGLRSRCPATFASRIVHQQSADQYAERVALPFRACVFGIPIVVQSAFVGDSDRVGIVAAGVGAGPLDRACGQDLSVTADVKNDSPCHQIHVGGARLPRACPVKGRSSHVALQCITIKLIFLISFYCLPLGAVR